MSAIEHRSGASASAAELRASPRSGQSQRQLLAPPHCSGAPSLIGAGRSSQYSLRPVKSWVLLPEKHLLRPFAIHESLHALHRVHELCWKDNRTVMFSCYIREHLKVTELQRYRMLGDNVRSFTQFGGG